MSRKQELLEYLRQIYEIRFFEEKVYELLGQDVIKGASHLYAGQEAVAVGAIAAVGENDLIASTHRGHGHCGAMGVKHCRDEAARQDHWNRMMAELMGKSTGYCKGRGGSMHIADVSRGNLGATGIVGGNIPIGTGAALAEKLKETKDIVLCFFGDGATNTGSFHESVNMGATWKLPIVYIVENNLYGMSVPFSGSEIEGTVKASALVDIADRAAAYGIEGFVVDGMDALAVRAGVERAAEKARAGGGPTMIEAKTYRWYGHSRSDPRKYRTKEEEKKWKERDPVIVLRNRLLEEEKAAGEELDRVRDRAQATIEAAVKFGLESPSPRAEELYDDVYVPLRVEENDIRREKELSRRIKEISTEIRRRQKEIRAAGKKITVKELLAQIQAETSLPVITFARAVAEAQAEEMRRDRNVIVMGEDVGFYGGAYQATEGLLKEFGPERVRDTAISEAAIAGAAAGAAMRGLRPVAEIMYVDFITLALDQLVHNAGYNRYMFGGKTTVPMVLRTEGGVGRCIAAHHSESLEAWIMHVPGLFLVMPSTPYDAKGLLKSAIRDDNPVVFIEHKAMYGLPGPVPKEEYLIPLGIADVKREGSRVTIVAYSRMVHEALAAAEILSADEGIEAEIIDPRTLKPLDIDTIARSVRKTGRLLTVSEGFSPCGVGREIVCRVLEYRFPSGEKGFDFLDAAPVSLAAAEVPPPMSETLEKASVPDARRIVEAVLTLLG